MSKKTGIALLSAHVIMILFILFNAIYAFSTSSNIAGLIQLVLLIINTLFLIGNVRIFKSLYYNKKGEV